MCGIALLLGASLDRSDHRRFDAMVAWHQPKYDVRLNIFNLTNKFYWDALIPSDGGRAVPGSGITGMLSVNYRF